MTENPAQPAMRIKEYFQSRYDLVQPPATDSDIIQAEEIIQIRFPQILRELYLLCNGFCGPIGSPYLLPLLGESLSLIDFTKMIRDFPSEDVSGFISFGSNAASHPLAMRELEDGGLRIVCCDPEASKFIELGNDLFEVYVEDERRCQEDVGNLS